MIKTFKFLYVFSVLINTVMTLFPGQGMENNED